MERGLITKDCKLKKCCSDDHAGEECCLERILSNQEDFKAQKSILEETLLGTGHMMTLYPKYHCETNWIERHWGEAKRVARANCDYTFATLKMNINDYLDDNFKRNGATIIRKWFNLAFRYINAYSEGNDAIQTNELIKKFSKEYKSHRRII